MSKILNWQIEIRSRSILYVPEGTRFLSVMVKHNLAYLYGLVPNLDAPPTPRILRVVSAGEEFNDANLTFVGSFQIDWFHGHLFEQPPRGESDIVDARYHDDHRELRRNA